MTHVLVIGAGPAGLAAAVHALVAGAEVTVLDAAHDIGGQFWRHLPPERSALREASLHHGWATFVSLSRTLKRHPSCRILTRAQVWTLDHEGERVRVHFAVGPADGDSRTMTTITGDALVIATGAHDRTLPFPGWDLPGVFSGGAAQAFAKSERIAIGERVVVAGAGPFLLPVASSLLATGARVAGVYEAAGAGAIARGWGAQIATMVSMPHKLLELGGYVAGQLRGRVPYRLASAVVAAHGTDRVESVTIARIGSDWAPIPGTEHVVEADAVAVSHGFVPRLELALAAGCALTPQRFVSVDSMQGTSRPGVYAAGELTGIGGADAALHEGAVAGWAAAGGDPHDRRIVAMRRRVLADRRFGRALEAAHGIRGGWVGWMQDDTVICRCEETTYGRLRTVADVTASRGLRSIKLTTRAGLGPCQGRICGRTVEEVVTGSGARPLLDDASIDRRPLAAILRFSELSQISDERRGPL
jgi:NADPH-dependent 2,4-dienoyl-CoA reductase/sulfur reductase-like enzyme